METGWGEFKSGVGLSVGLKKTQGDVWKIGNNVVEIWFSYGA